MKDTIARVMACALASAGLSTVIVAEAHAAAAAPAYRAPRNAFGQPDMMGTWSNETLTPWQRPPQLGERMNYSEDEVARLEAARAAALAAGDKPTDLSKSSEELNKAGCDVPEFGDGSACAYNSAWVDRNV